MLDQSQFEYSGNSSFALLVFRLIIRLEKSVVGYARLELSAMDAERPPKNLITNFAHQPRLALCQSLLNKHSFYWHSWLSQDKRTKPILDRLIFISPIINPLYRGCGYYDLLLFLRYLLFIFRSANNIHFDGTKTNQTTAELRLRSNKFYLNILQICLKNLVQQRRAPYLDMAFGCCYL